MKIGDKVHYHPIFGRPHNGTVYEIRALGTIPSAPEDPVAWLIGKAGCVSLRHLSPIPVEAP